ncbi:ROK family glucokinase [Pontibacillus yanchengensis]|uniref:ROK family glucokinase n=2 Tax=Pontibacillus yanchengensis TaxID=462910 RepID=A0ACC7VF37_9BACI|nr:ROK family glucokinase [Pontibacillus yanchengensis]MYL53526.1 ROK family glucokinase [Pontibacillus yanchengensis]
MSTKHLIGIDIGGTTVKIAFITYDGVIMEKWEIPTNKSDEAQNVVPDIAISIRDKQKEKGYQHDDFAAIGVGAPGFIDVDSGMIHEAVNVGWKNYHLSEELKQASGYKVWVENDANLAALGENWKGSGDRANHMIAVTLGTGVGGGIIANGQLLHGANGTVAEIGHMTVETEKPLPCNCGKSGCLETVTSATAISKLAKIAIEEGKKTSLAHTLKETEDITAKDVFEASTNGDQVAEDILAYVIEHLGRAIANLAIALNPSKIVIGGGVSKAGDQLLIPLRAVFDRYALTRTSHAAEIVMASLGNDAGVMGAAYFAKEEL